MGHIHSCFTGAGRGDAPDTTHLGHLSTAGSASSLQRQEGPRQLGKGQCGTVWALGDLVFKAPNECKHHQLWEDSCHHRKVEDALQRAPWAIRPRINIPRWTDLVHPSEETFWDGFRSWFPSNFQPTCGILSTRIHPVRPHVRHAIVDLFAPPSIKANKTGFLACPQNHDCLVRLYLGRRAERSASAASFRLRDFDLMVNEMEYMQLDIGTWARDMARTLAVLHWRAQVDANGVEFVLGRTGDVEAEFRAISLSGMRDRLVDRPNVFKFELSSQSMGVWLLDFDQCRTFPESPEGVKQLQRAFYLNDPYYPRPVSKHPNDVALWETFKAAYLQASAFLKPQSRMPRLFIQAVEEEGRRRAAGGSV
ncbi:uncharacterized protein Z520_06251 [Fonsecaea multimorphosa CBS 102226]|uniref:DUF3669 domain-containing protein n=1 Tax=Fonsecaea multimorphosa CBS 102226 TaxID=1442371 RepID=A0A0D2IMB4_9EURO|nr:uncharacterized protein Z520_06251 [Fonsecaea multimorphosa CBS 102226]KIX98171.1 hypothetical protein Z520_06251 [Fonsecaea multimorphosa CBS 102226]OAL24246.1 hypothetical protein AYO22_05906 [Fonsecaea multimorphosa]